MATGSVTGRVDTPPGRVRPWRTVSKEGPRSPPAEPVVPSAATPVKTQRRLSMGCPVMRVTDRRTATGAIGVREGWGRAFAVAKRRHPYARPETRPKARPDIARTTAPRVAIREFGGSGGVAGRRPPLIGFAAPRCRSRTDKEATLLRRVATPKATA